MTVPQKTVFLALRNRPQPLFWVEVSPTRPEVSYLRCSLSFGAKEFNSKMPIWHRDNDEWWILCEKSLELLDSVAASLGYAVLEGTV